MKRFLVLSTIFLTIFTLKMYPIYGQEMLVSENSEEQNVYAEAFHKSARDCFKRGNYDSTIINLDFAKKLRRLEVEDLPLLVAKTCQQLEDSAYNSLKYGDLYSTKKYLHLLIALNPDDNNAATLYQEIIRKLDKNTSGMAFVQGGKFFNITDDSEQYTEISSFFIDKYEVTNAQYAKFLNEKQPETSTLKIWLNLEHSAIVYKDNHYSVKQNADSLPVTYVSWFGAQEYAQHYGKSLPSVLQWEYAAMGGVWHKTNKFPESFDFTNQEHVGFARNMAWFNKNSDNTLRKVGMKSKNMIGAYDMFGNVKEWCTDWYQRPAGVTQFTEQILDTDVYKTAKGGAFNSTLQHLHPKTLFPYSVYYTDNTTGFRCIYIPQFEYLVEK